MKHRLLIPLHSLENSNNCRNVVSGYESSFKIGSFFIEKYDSVFNSVQIHHY